MWTILIRLINKEIKSLVLLILTSNTMTTYQQQQQQQQQQQYNQFFSSGIGIGIGIGVDSSADIDIDIDDGYSVEEKEWIKGRDVECLFFMLMSLMDCVCEPSTPPSSLPCPSSSSSSSYSSTSPSPAPSSFFSPSHVDIFPSSQSHVLFPSNTLNQATSHPHTHTHSHPQQHQHAQSPLNNIESKSSPTFLTANSRPSFQNNKTENFYSTPQRSWFSDVTYVTCRILEHEAVQDEILRKLPAVGIRLLQLWSVMPSPRGSV